MKTKLSNALVALALLCLYGSSSAQFTYPYIENFGAPNEVNLAAPYPGEGTLLLPVGTDLYDGNDVNTIYYGLTPPNSSSKPVLVFVHGYASSASVWYDGLDNMYKDVYQDGYRTAFVSLTPNRHMWTNGYMLARMINVITQHYGVSSVKVVGWSKGGVDTDAALVHFGANSKVSEAFTLSSPHQGTGIAELANNILLSLVNIIFMQNNDATKSLTRGYMSYYRSLTDGLSSNNTPFTTFGAWGNGPLARLSIPQGYLYLAGGSKSSGGNDGVVPYSSSRRPGGRELFSGQRKEYGFLGIPYYPGPSQTELDHFEVTRGGLVWPYVKGVFNGSLRTPAPVADPDYNPNQLSSSRMQLVASAGGASTFSISNEGNARLFVLRQNGSTPLQIMALDGGQAPKLVPSSEEQLENATGTWYDLGGLRVGEYRLEGDGVFAAMIEEEEGAAAILELGFAAGERVFQTGAAAGATVRIEGALPEGLQVTGTVQRLHDLDLQDVNEAPVPVSAEQQDGGIHGISLGADLAPGIYSLSINALGQNFRRSINTTFAVVGDEKAKKAETPGIGLTAFPNPFTERLQIDLGDVETQELRVYNVFGQEISRIAVRGQQQVEWNAAAEGASPGIYILQAVAKDGSKRQVQAIMQ